MMLTWIFLELEKTNWHNELEKTNWTKRIGQNELEKTNWTKRIGQMVVLDK